MGGPGQEPTVSVSWYCGPFLIQPWVMESDLADSGVNTGRALKYTRISQWLGGGEIGRGGDRDLCKVKGEQTPLVPGEWADSQELTLRR